VIYVLFPSYGDKDVDGRDEPGHDESGFGLLRRFDPRNDGSASLSYLRVRSDSAPAHFGGDGPYLNFSAAQACRLPSIGCWLPRRLGEM
jgi:hypothetical protein